MNLNIRSIHFKLTFWYVMMLIVIMITFSTLIYFSLYHSQINNIDTSIQSQAEWIASLLDILESPDFLELEEDLNEHISKIDKGQFIGIRQSTGNIIYKSKQLDQNLPLDTEVLKRALDNENTLETINDPTKGTLRLITLPVEDDRKIAYIIQVAVSLKEVQRTQRQLITIFLVSSIAVIIISIFVGNFLAKKALKPVDDIIKTTRKIKAENMSQRLDVPPTEDEISRLAATINDMIDRLERAFQQIRQFTADASHELRTPLTAMRGQTEVALRRERSADEYRQVLESNLEDIEWMSWIVESLLTLSRIDAGEIRLEINSVRLDELLKDAHEECKFLAYEKNIEVFLDKLKEITILGDEMRLRQMMLNLIDNAVKYTNNNGQIRLSLEEESDSVKLLVKDNGIGISQEDLPHIFDRFFRVDKVRSREMGGSGLGLSIVQWIVEAHQGHIEVISELGKGSCFTISLPKNCQRC